MYTMQVIRFERTYLLMGNSIHIFIDIFVCVISHTIFVFAVYILAFIVTEKKSFSGDEKACRKRDCLKFKITKKIGKSGCESCLHEGA